MMLRSFIIVLAMVLMCGAAPGDTLRLMTYNIRECKGWVTPDTASETNALDEVVAVIRAAEPGVICLQEVDLPPADCGFADHTRRLAEKTGLFPSFAVANVSASGWKWGVAVLSKRKPLATRTLQFPKTRCGPQRAALIAEFEDHVVCSTHFGLVATDCEEEAKLLVAELAKETKPVFLCGDLNSKPDSRTIAILKGAFDILTDVSRNTCPADNPDKCIDYVMLDRRHAGAFRMEDRELIENRTASDHLPWRVTVRRTPSVVAQSGKFYEVSADVTADAPCCVEFGTTLGDEGFYIGLNGGLAIEGGAGGEKWHESHTDCMGVTSSPRTEGMSRYSGRPRTTMCR